VRAMDVFTTCCRGQRLGVFAGSGVGKSVLLSMLARHAACDAVVVGLIGERGREVREFIEETLGPAGLERAIVVVATSDEPALKRRQAAYMTMAVAEFLRDQDLEVLCLMDSVTRFAMAQREIGLAAGEPPTTRGYTPTVFSELPKLLERAGPGPVRPDGAVAGPITGLFTVLVDGDDHNEPIADAVRGILDGHIVMERAIAERGRFPAINVLKSISRTMPGCQTPLERETVSKARTSLAAYANMEELIRIGAYRSGADAEVDRAIALHPSLEGFLSQDKDDYTSLPDAFDRLDGILEREGA
jgi:flagellum-specific ATP synthase